MKKNHNPEINNLIKYFKKNSSCNLYLVNRILVNVQAFSMIMQALAVKLKLNILHNWKKNNLECIKMQKKIYYVPLSKEYLTKQINNFFCYSVWCRHIANHAELIEQNYCGFILYCVVNVMQSIDKNCNKHRKQFTNTHIYLPSEKTCKSL